MLFVITAMDKEDSLALRMATRAAHFDYATATGVVKLGGPFLDAKGDMIGSLIIIEAADMGQARSWQENDPYAKAGLFSHVELRPWKATANHCKADFR
ncbi:MAG TPA: YciI family protein [Rhizomicrobium sp.]|nr:YciI family protein [Rhizomicrobium sp.]